ncbi:hypothetical protein ACTQZM_12050, partial [Enterococcus cecorum]|uniref:hypothetical protein n=1 Tax=Enterococcus cecorum TaxID=44008 RepID=UPI003F906B70
CHGQKLYKQIVNKKKNLQRRVTLEIFNIPRYWALTNQQWSHQNQKRELLFQSDSSSSFPFQVIQL